MKAYWEMEVHLNACLISAKHGDEKCQNSFQKGGLQLQLSLSKPRMCIGEVVVQLHAFSTSVLDGGEWANSRPGPFISGKDLILF